MMTIARMEHNPTTDERAGRPSASALPRLSKCPASWLLAKEAKRQGIIEPSNPDADSGTRIHAWLAGEKVELSEDELDTAERCRKQEAEVRADWLEAIGESGQVQSDIELRLWLGDRFSGKPDLVYGCFTPHGGSQGLCINYKTGRADTPAAAGNGQMLGEAVLLAENYALSGCRVAIVQPWVGPPSIADYDAAALAEAKRQLLALLAEIEKPGLVPNPGKWCQYCPARGGVCPATRADVRALEAVSSTMEAVAAAVVLLDGPGIRDFLEAGKRAEWAIEAARAEAKRRLAIDPDSVPGWKLTEGKRTRKITDAQAAFERLSESTGLTAEEMLGCVKASLPEIEKAVAKRTKNPVKTAELMVADILGMFIEYGRTAGSLEEVK